MFEKGKMRPYKLVLGIALALIVLNYLFPVSFVNNILVSYPWLQYLLMGISAYFLIRTGRQLQEDRFATQTKKTMGKKQQKRKKARKHLGRVARKGSTR